MKYVVFSDIHGNIYALEKMIQETKHEADGYIFLGDICGYFVHQKECIKWMQKLPNRIYVAGNHERYYLQAIADKEKQNMLIEKYGQSYNHTLGESDISFLESLPDYYDGEIDGLKICCVHGGMGDYLEERIYPDQIVKYIREHNINSDVILSGHTHYGMYYRMPNGKIWINPGSLGQPRDGKGFSYCVIDFSTREHQFRSVNIDNKKLEAEIRRVERNSLVGQYLMNALKR